MSDAESGTFPRRDADGRISSLTDLLGVSLAGLVIGLLTLIVFEWALATIGIGGSGRANGWLAVLLPVWLFTEEFRSWRFGAARVVAALVAAGLGVIIGLLAAGLAHDLPPLASGASAAAAFTVSYALIWFYGVRWLTRRTG